MMEKTFFIYILASKPNGTLYIGVTSNLVRRVWQHREKTFEGFADDYDVNLLVYYETHKTVESAILREKQLKKWNRVWKLRLIEKFNPKWKDLYLEMDRGFSHSL